MGFIVNDHDKGIHGELRRESFTIFSDYGTDWSVELDLDKLDELIYVARQVKKHRDEGKQYSGRGVRWKNAQINVAATVGRVPAHTVTFTRRIGSVATAASREMTEPCKSCGCTSYQYGCSCDCHY